MRFYRYIVCAFLFIGAAIAETININWINDNETYAQTTCEIGGDVILPTTPTKRGYTFVGWFSYTRLEYIESSGTQWIDTGITSYKNTYKYEFTIRKNISSTTFVSFQNPGGGAENIGLFTNTTGYAVQNGRGSRVFLSVDNTNFHNIILEKYGVTLDGQKSAITSSTDFTVSGNLYVFTCDAVESRRFVGSIALFKVYDENNNLILNLIPAKRNFDSAIGMYDTVSQKFFTNQGTGEFIAGPVAENQNFDE